MSSTQKQIAALQKRVASIENQLKQDANLLEIRGMLADIVKSVNAGTCAVPGAGAADGPGGAGARAAPRVRSHIVQTRFRVL